MIVSNEAIEYIADRFREGGYIAPREDIARVFLYEEEHFQRDVKDNDMTVSVAVIDMDDLIDYIHNKKPALSREDIEDVLEFQDDAYQWMAGD